MEDLGYVTRRNVRGNQRQVRAIVENLQRAAP
jgi:hypothetical protein